MGSTATWHMHLRGACACGQRWVGRRAQCKHFQLRRCRAVLQLPCARRGTHLGSPQLQRAGAAVARARRERTLGQGVAWRTAQLDRKHLHVWKGAPAPHARSRSRQSVLTPGFSAAGRRTRLRRRACRLAGARFSVDNVHRERAAARVCRRAMAAAAAAAAAALTLGRAAQSRGRMGGWRAERAGLRVRAGTRGALVDERLLMVLLLRRLLRRHVRSHRVLRLQVRKPVHECGCRAACRAQAVVQSPFLTSEHRWLCHRSRACLSDRPSSDCAITAQPWLPSRCTAWMSSLSSAWVHACLPIMRCARGAPSVALGCITARRQKSRKRRVRGEPAQGVLATRCRRIHA
jgi:hypothetical protein